MNWIDPVSNWLTLLNQIILQCTCCYLQKYTSINTQIHKYKYRIHMYIYTNTQILPRKQKWANWPFWIGSLWNASAVTSAAYFILQLNSCAGVIIWTFGATNWTFGVIRWILAEVIEFWYNQLNFWWERDAILAKLQSGRGRLLQLVKKVMVSDWRLRWSSFWSCFINLQFTINYLEIIENLFQGALLINKWKNYFHQWIYRSG